MIEILSTLHSAVMINVRFEYIFNNIGWLVVLRINVDLAIFQPYLDLEAGDNQSMKIQVARPGIEPRSSCSASQELNHSATAALTLTSYSQQVMHVTCLLVIRWLKDRIQVLIRNFQFEICACFVFLEARMGLYKWKQA